MVAQKKGGAAGKQKQTKGPQKKAPPKMFEDKFEDDDFDDDDVDMDSDEGSDSDDAPQPGQKTPGAGRKTPARSAKKDAHVSFQVQEKTPGSMAKMQQQKLRTPTPMVPKKQQTQNLREQTLKKGMTGSPALKEFSGMKGPGSAKKDKSPAQKSNAGAKRKSQEEEEEDDDDDDEDDDDFEDMSDLDEEEDDDDEDDDEDDDDEEDEDLDSEEEKKIVKKAQAALAKNKQQKQTGPQTPASKKQQSNAGSPQKNNQKQNNTSLKDRTPKKDIGQESAELEALKDLRSLYVRNIPKDIEPDELKILSPDIQSVRIPRLKWQQQRSFMWGFLEFESEAKAEENMKRLKDASFKGCKLMFDFVGVKSSNKDVASKQRNREKNMLKLNVMGLSDDTTIAQVANLFPKANWIQIMGKTGKSASVLFNSESDAMEAMKANLDAKLNGKILTILFDTKQDKKRKFVQKKKSRKQPPMKKRKMESGSDDDDED